MYSVSSSLILVSVSSSEKGFVFVVWHNSVLWTLEARQAKPWYWNDNGFQLPHLSTPSHLYAGVSEIQTFHKSCMDLSVRWFFIFFIPEPEWCAASMHSFLHFSSFWENYKQTPDKVGSHCAFTQNLFLLTSHFCLLSSKAGQFVFVAIAGHYLFFFYSLSFPLMSILVPVCNVMTNFAGSL